MPRSCKAPSTFLLTSRRRLCLSSRSCCNTRQRSVWVWSMVALLRSRLIHSSRTSIGTSSSTDSCRHRSYQKSKTHSTHPTSTTMQMSSHTSSTTRMMAQTGRQTSKASSQTHVLCAVQKVNSENTESSLLFANDDLLSSHGFHMLA